MSVGTGSIKRVAGRAADMEEMKTAGEVEVEAGTATNMEPVAEKNPPEGKKPPSVKKLPTDRKTAAICNTAEKKTSEAKKIASADNMETTAENTCCHLTEELPVHLL
ncbi:MAG: hypothetical protein ACLT3H_03020 [Roseburia sp.]